MKCVKLGLLLSCIAGMSYADTLLKGTMGESTGQSIIEMNKQEIFAGIPDGDGGNYTIMVELKAELEKVAVIHVTVGHVVRGDGPKELGRGVIQLDWGVDTPVIFVTDGIPLQMVWNATPSFLGQLGLQSN